MKHIVKINYIDRQPDDPPLTGLQVTRYVHRSGGTRVSALLSVLQDADEHTRENIVGISIVHPLDYGEES